MGTAVGSVGEGLRNILAFDQKGTICREVLDGGMLLCGLGAGAGERTICLHELGRENPGMLGQSARTTKYH